jgi:hypothetical protein
MLYAEQIRLFNAQGDVYYARYGMKLMKESSFLDIATPLIKMIKVEEDVESLFDTAVYRWYRWLAEPARKLSVY